ncbi:hypothetical protein OE747_00605 [Ruegeria sp. XHP0148]|uniref:Uncharacterized protein n=2 Tax=Ruegeria aquimaris TaxID=2984333 RepID=A0ABT3AF01_9RHOB|nr:hypothetical protein [Ruegeria sp. XHP0148]
MRGVWISTSGWELSQNCAPMVRTLPFWKRNITNSGKKRRKEIECLRSVAIVEGSAFGGQGLVRSDLAARKWEEK